MTNQQHIRKVHRLVATYPAFTGGTRQCPEPLVVWKLAVDVEPGESTQGRMGEGEDTQAEQEQSR